ncbi:MAG: ATP-binding protein [Bacteroidales bacterium]|nr:ATP-binding protein [Bacteroidales bacterium]
MPSNPFKFGKIVYGEHFYNRDKELAKIKATLSSGNNVALYAPRRYGKSSLVAKALEELEKEGYLCVHFDFMSVYSQKTFMEYYSKEILNSQRRFDIKAVISRFTSLVKNIKASVSFDHTGNPEFTISFIENTNKEESLIDIINLPEQLAGEDQKYIIAFDEFQEITKLNGENFEKLLRSQLQKHENVSYIFFGSKPHLLKDMFNNKNRAFYNAAYIMNLEKMAEQDSISFLQNAFASSEITLSTDMACYIIRKADNIPYYIQFLAHQVWEFAMIHNNNTIEQPMVDDALQSILELKNDYYWELTNHQSNHRKKLLLALSHDAKELYSDATSKKYELGAASSTQKSLDVLLNEGIIEKNMNNYEFADPMYKTFIKHNL